MPLLGFRAEFADAVELGTKRQTIRARRRDGRDPKPGDTLYLYAGLRTKGARKLAEVRCTSVEPVRITADRGGEVWFGDDLLTLRESEEFARADGLATWRNFLNWFDRVHGLPFDGLLIRWTREEA